MTIQLIGAVQIIGGMMVRAWRISTPLRSCLWQCSAIPVGKAEAANLPAKPGRCAAMVLILLMLGLVPGATSKAQENSSYESALENMKRDLEREIKSADARIQKITTGKEQNGLIARSLQRFINSRDYNEQRLKDLEKLQEAVRMAEKILADPNATDAQKKAATSVQNIVKNFIQKGNEDTKNYHRPWNNSNTPTNAAFLGNVPNVNDLVRQMEGRGAGDGAAAQPAQSQKKEVAPPSPMPPPKSTTPEPPPSKGSKNSTSFRPPGKPDDFAFLGTRPRYFTDDTSWRDDLEDGPHHFHHPGVPEIAVGAGISAFVLAGGGLLLLADRLRGKKKSKS
jgi:flagellar hook-basal body complex protein FliE